MNNLLANLPLNKRHEQFEDLLQGGKFRIERIVSNGHTTPPDEWYDQSTDEWVVLLAGAARLRFEKPEQVYEMQPGDHINIPARQRHRVEWTDPNNSTVWLAIHYQPGEQDEDTTVETG
ncbi:MAG: cupin domain-containing protein [Pirellulaceae bacterium]|nr:cupin domain-containing protein [Pirellulaceae bacterium]MDP6717040.1 cupin domain-containing protein [Pirellulaceae bacterium]